MAPSSGLSFTVHRRPPELVAPAKVTPREVKLLSDIDDQGNLRVQIPGIQFYGGDPLKRGRDVVDIIRKALAKALVFYYPFAGRLRQGPNGKLMVDCTGDGVLFIEADADITLEEFGDLHPPFPCFEELLYDVPGTSDLLNTPLLLIQVTRLKCEGFIFALRLNHTMSDAIGLVQFIGEIARGAYQPSILPIWRRELLNARDPPCVTCMPRDYQEAYECDNKEIIIPSMDNLVSRSFFFGPNEISSIRTQFAHHLHKSCSNFEIITASLWRCLIMALQLNDDDKVRISYPVNVRSKFNPHLPKGYYGNALASPMATATAGELRKNPLGYALELVKKMKYEVSEEYMHSLADFMAIKGRPPFKMVGMYCVSDVTRVGFRDVDFGWGKALFGGPMNAYPLASCFIPYKNKQGQEGIVIPFCLPSEVMERFVKELDKILKTRLITSSL